MRSHTPAAVPATPTSRFTTLFRSPVPDRATEFMASLYRPHLLQVGRTAGFDMALAGFELGGLHVGSVRYGSATRAQLAPGRGCWIFSWLRSGQLQAGRRGVCHPAGAAFLLAPDDTPELHMSSDIEIVNLRVDQADLEAACRAMLGVNPGPGFRCQQAVGPDHPAAQALRRLTDMLAATPDYAQDVAGRFSRSVRDAVLFELLLTWPGAHSADLQVPAAMPATLRRAREYIHAHLQDVPTVADVAQACGVGVRALAKGFGRHLGMSPSQYLLDLRLERVRAQLLQKPDIGSVTAVAQSWGFSNPGQFAARYRQRFGERPSETLRRLSVSAD